MAGPHPYLRLLCSWTLFSVGCEVLAGMCIAQLCPPDHAPDLPEVGLWREGAWLAVPASVLILAAGTVWKETNRSEDAVDPLGQPLSRGARSLVPAVVISLMLAGVLISPCPLHHVLIAALAVAYGFLPKRMPYLAAATMGVLRGLNLVTAAAIPVTYSGILGITLGPMYTTGLLGGASSTYWATAVCYALYRAYKAAIGR